MSKRAESSAGEFWAGATDSEALRRFRTLVDAVDDGIYQLDPEDRFVAVNEAITRLSGYDRDDLVGEHVSFLFGPADADRIEREIRNRPTVDGPDERSLEATLRTAAGEPVDCELQLNALLEDDEFRGTVGIVRDVTDRKPAANRLRERERKRERQRDNLAAELEEIYGRITDGFVAVNEDWELTHVNERAERLLGVDASELLGETIWDASPDAVDTVFEERYREVMASQEPASFVSFHEGTDAWYEVHVYPSDTGLSVYFRDITERKEIERELRESKRQFQQIAENIEEVIWLAPPEKTEMTYVNPAYEDVWGRSRESLYDDPRSFLEGIHPADRDRVRNALGEQSEGEYDETYRVVRPDGEIRWVRDRSFPIEDESGEVFRIVGIAEDITDRKEREHDLELFRTLLDHSDDAVFVEDPDTGEVLDCNDTATRHLGYSRDELLGLTVPDIETELSTAGEYREFVAELKAEGQTTFRGTRRRKDESTYPVEVNASYVELGETAYVLAVSRDITERRERERRYRTLIENFPNGAVALVDENLQYVTFGGTVEGDVDISRTELEGTSLPDVLPEQIADVVVPHYEAALEGETSQVTETIDDRTYRFHFLPVRDDDGEVFAAMAMSQDVTERERAKRRLEESERRYRTLVENFPNGAVGLFDHDLEYQVVGGAILEEVGVSADEIVGTSVTERYPEPLAEKMARNFRAALDGETRDFELEFHDRHWYAYAIPVEDEDGEVFAGMVMVQDVTERTEMRRELRESEAKFRIVAENLDEVVWMTTPDLDTFLYVNPTYEDIYGQDPTALYDDPYAFAERLHPDDRERVLEAWRDLPDEPYEEEFRIIRPDGETRWIHAQATRVHDETGDVTRIVGIANDVTDRKERERKLREAKSQLEAAIDAGAVGTWEWHVSEDWFVAGEAFARTFDVDPEAAQEGVGIDRFVSSIHDADRERVRRAIDEAIESCGEYEEEYRVRNAEGELRWVLARGHVECDDDGNPITFPGTLVDITDRKRAEQELERTTDQLETLFDVLPVGVVVANADGSLRRANDVAREIWGGDVFDAESVADYEKYDAVWADTGDPVDPAEWTMAQVLRGEEVMEPNVYEIDTFDGKRRTIMEHGKPVRDERGTVRRAVVTLTDVTERRQYRRKLEESNERLEQFAYAASHDLQEPLRMVSSYLQLLEDRYGNELDEDATEFIDYAVDGADRMREMIDGLLEYSRIETQGDPLEPVALEGVLTDVRTDLQLQIEESDAEIAAEPLPTVEGDEDQLRQLFQNLLENAIEYSGDEPPQVHIATERRGTEWVVSVSDEGIGIDPEEQERIFEVFERLHSREEHPGTGIGLALCERIVERHGGDIRVDSEPGEGTAFSFTLPATTESES